MIACSSVEVEYWAMAHTACELIWMQSLLSEIVVVSSQPMVMRCDNQATMYITNNHVFRERMKHIEIDCHFIRDMVTTKRIVMSYVTFESSAR